MSTAFLLTAAGVGAAHTLFAPNHYLPFIVIARVNGWNYAKTLWVTLFCGLAHIVSSLTLGLAGVAFGFALSNISIFEEHRGALGAGVLILFGLGYFIWGLGQAHKHRACCHYHEGAVSSAKTVWALFLVFLIMPCEIWLPFLMVPAIEQSYLMISLIALTFSISTVACMALMVSLGYYGAQFLPFKRYERWGHAAAGAVILLCGIVLVLAEHAHHIH